MRFGDNTLTNIMFGNNQITKRMYGDKLIWEWEHISWHMDMIITDVQTADVYDFERIFPDETDGTTILNGVVSIVDHQPFQTKYEFANISNAVDADILLTNSPIQDGDNLVIVNDDNSIHEMVASGVTLPSVVDPQTWVAPDAGSSQDVSHTFTVPHGTITLHVVGSTAAAHDFFYVYDETDTQIAKLDGLGIDETYKINGNTCRVRLVSEWGASEGPIQATATNNSLYTMDTLAVTQGEIPTRVYTVDAKSSFAISGDYVEAVGIPSYTYTNPVLSDTRSYENLIDDTGSTTISPKIELKSIGDKMIELRGSIVK